MASDLQPASRQRQRRLWFAASGALLGWLGLGLQLAIALKGGAAAGRHVVGSIFEFISYFTIWTNLLAAIALSCSALDGWRPGLGGPLAQPLAMSGLAICMSLVSMTYHTLLSGLWQPAGTQLLADNLLHSVSPALFLMFWWLFVPPIRTGRVRIFRWAIFPAIYLAFALIRGAAGYAYTYPFIDAATLGYARVALNAVGVVLVFFVIGLLLIWLDGRKR